MIEKTTQTNDNFIEKLVKIRRTAKVVKGGRVFGFSALSVVGDGNGQIGFGTGKAREVPIAIQKSLQKARRDLKKIYLNNGTLFYPIRYKYGATRIIMLPAFEGTGIIAGGVMRSIFESVGIKNIIAKCIGSRCSNNVVLATIKGLLMAQKPKHFELKRGVTINKVFFKK